MEQILEPAIYEGVDVDFLFESEKPTFGDLFQICGYDHPKFPASGNFNFGNLAELGFEQVDDYFGITSYEDEGDDVVVWLYPLVDAEPVSHDPGPFSGIRLSYNVLRNPVEKIDSFLKVVTTFAQELPARAFYRLRNAELGTPPDLSVLQADMNRIVEHWQAQGIEPGSSEALRVEY